MRPTRIWRRLSLSSPACRKRSPIGGLIIAGLAFLLIASSTIYGQTPDSPGKGSDDVVIIPRAQYEQYRAAVDELAAARPYIKTLETERDLRISIDKLQEQRAGIQDKISASAIAEAEAERRARIATEKALERETSRADMNEREIKRRDPKVGSFVLKAAIAVAAVLILK